MYICHEDTKKSLDKRTLCLRVFVAKLSCNFVHILILEIAEEKGLEKGKALGLQEGKALVLDAMREMVIEALLERFNLIPDPLSKRIRAIHNQDVLKGLLHQALKCQSLQEFDAVIDQVSG